MKNVRFDDEVVKEMRRLARDYKHRDAFIAALTKIYTTGYDNGLGDSTRKIREVLDVNNKSANPSNNDDGVVVQPSSSESSGSGGTDAVDADSGEGSTKPTFGYVPGQEYWGMEPD